MIAILDRDAYDASEFAEQFEDYEDYVWSAVNAGNKASRAQARAIVTAKAKAARQAKRVRLFWLAVIVMNVVLYYATH